jgi:uncharacterized membrane protein
MAGCRHGWARAIDPGVGSVRALDSDSTPGQASLAAAADAAEQAHPELAPRLLRSPLHASWRERIIVLGSVAAAVLLALALGLAYARQQTLELLGLIPVSVLVAGKFLPLWGISGKSQFSPYELGILIGLMDTVTVLIMVYTLELIHRMGRLSAALTKIQTNAALVLTAYPRIRRTAVIGVVLFVMFPIAGTGAVGGVFLGLLLGLHRFVLMAAISAGGFLGGISMAIAAIYFGEAVQKLRALQSDPAIQWAILVGIGLLVLALILWMNRVYKRALLVAQAEVEARQRSAAR